LIAWHHRKFDCLQAMRGLGFCFFAFSEAVFSALEARLTFSCFAKKK
jgi:hypothetical protein